MSLLCKIGLHGFKPWAFNSVVNPIPIERCVRCGVGRQWVGHGGQVRYTREQLGELSRSANQAGRVEPEVEYWVEPIPGSGSKLPPFRVESRAHGLRFLRDNRNSPLYQLVPRRKG